MAEDRARPQQAVARVDVQVTAAVGEQLAHPLDLQAILGQMGVYEHVRVLARQAPRALELRHRGRRCEARRDRIQQAFVAVPRRDELAHLALAPGRAVAQSLRAVSVHERLARDHAQPARGGGLEEGLGRTLVNRAEHLRRSRALTHKLIEKELGHGARIDRIGETQLGRVRVVFEPFEQIAPAGGDHVHLRIVDMRVDEARHDQPLTMFYARQLLLAGRRQQRCGWPHRLDATVRHDECALFAVLVGGGIVLATGVCAEVQDRAAVRYTRHGLHPSGRAQ